VNTVETETEHPRRLIVIDTDPGVRWALEKGLKRSGYEVRPCLVCTSIDADPHVVTECMRRGAADFLAKPFGLSEIRRAVREALDYTKRATPDPALQAAETSGDDSSQLVGVSPAMQELRVFIKQVARTDLNCLIRGESGVGKDMVAREIHRLSRRRDKPFVKVNCTALPEMLLESELFGYEKGAFTGAAAPKPGRFSLAHEGIILLDEIGEMHPHLQAKILQVIEHKEFTKLGASKTTTVDVQIIAATNTDLEQKTSSGAFRNDLYYRMNEICIWVPALRERREDVPLLVHHFLQKHSRYSASSKPSISGDILAALSERDWPGNVRELESTIKRWLVLGEQALSPNQPGMPVAPVVAAPPAAAAASPPPAKAAPKRQLAPEEILAALERHKWNRRETARALGIGYQALRRRIEKFQLEKRR